MSNPTANTPQITPVPAITLGEEIQSLARELKFRPAVYRKRVDNGKMTQAQADHEIGCTQATLTRLQAIGARKTEVFHFAETGLAKIEAAGLAELVPAVEAIRAALELSAALLPTLDQMTLTGDVLVRRLNACSAAADDAADAYADGDDDRLCHAIQVIADQSTPTTQTDLFGAFETPEAEQATGPQKPTAAEHIELLREECRAKEADLMRYEDALLAICREADSGIPHMITRGTLTRILEAHGVQMPEPTTPHAVEESRPGAGMMLVNGKQVADQANVITDGLGTVLAVTGKEVVNG